MGKRGDTLRQNCRRQFCQLPFREHKNVEFLYKRKFKSRTFLVSPERGGAELARRRGVTNEYKEREHEKNNSGAGVGGVTECV